MIDTFAHKAGEWDSAEKIKMTEKFVVEMLQHISPQKTWKALEIGAGTGLVGLQIEHLLAQVVFEDTSAAMLGVLKQKKSSAITLHGEVFDYKEQDIDLVFSCMAFHHLPDIEKTLQHLAFITKSNATVVIADLVSEDGSFHNFEPIPHRGFHTAVLSEQFRAAGFEIQTAHLYHTFLKTRIDGTIGKYEQFILVARKIFK